ncbi:MAG TPA: polysaccharide biosynthesis/export family protein [Blastocatellia bacterium]|nr:polysaccharide biosynthesis/export family protein [Blastocatellia bacterium]
MKGPFPFGSLLTGYMTSLLALTALFSACALGQTATRVQPPSQTPPTSEGHAADNSNQRLRQLLQKIDATDSGSASASQDYRIGSEDLLNISVYGAPDLSGKTRVAADGSISLPLLGTVQAAGLTSNQLKGVLEELLHRTYMKDPHVSIVVEEMESHSVSVFGAVEKPGVFQIRGPKSLVEVLSMAEGLANDAGDTVIVMRHDDAATLTSAVADYPGPEAGVGQRPLGGIAQPKASLVKSDPAPASKSIEINLKNLLDTGDSRYDVLVYPGDVVKVTRAGVVYVIGEVNKPGGYLLKTNENISVLQAIALAEGETHTAAGKHARIIRTEGATGARTEIPINLNSILAGRAPDPLLHAKDIIFVPNNTGKAALYHGTEGILSTLGGAAIYRW